MAVLCLFTYLLGGTKILPGLVVMAAAIEGSHTLLASSSDAGCALVLHHEQRAGGEAVHRHGVASRVFCLLATPEDSDPDHVLQMAAGAVSESPSMGRGTWYDEKSSDLADSFSPAPLWQSAVVPDGFLSVFSVERHPPPRESGHLAALRITVLVI